MHKTIYNVLHNGIVYSSVSEDTIGDSKMDESQKTQWWSKETRHKEVIYTGFYQIPKTTKQISGDRSEDTGYLEV